MRNLSAIQAGFEAQTIPEKNYIKYCKQYGLNPEWLNKSVKIDTTVFTCRGLVKMGRLAFIEMEASDTWNKYPWEIKKFINTFSSNTVYE